MKIGLLIYGSLEILSGGYLYDRQLVNHLRSAGDQVEVISLLSRSYLRHLPDNFSGALKRRLANLPLDILLQDELNHPSLFYLNYGLRKQVHYPLVSIIHHLRSSESRPAWRNNLYRWVENRYLRSVDGFVFNSDTTRQVVQSLVGESRPSVVAFPAGDRLRPDLNREQIVLKAKQNRALQLLFLGNVIPRKGLHTLLQALAHIPGHLWYLTVVGNFEMDKPYMSRIMMQVKEYGLEDLVQFTGSLGEDGLIQVMHHNHVMVVPSSYEGFGIAYLEGMGFGLPAIASTAGGASEIVTHGLDGFLIPPENFNLLAGYIRRLIEDREFLAKMSLAAQERYLRHPTWEQNSQRIRTFLVDMIQGKPSS